MTRRSIKTLARLSIFILPVVYFFAGPISYQAQKIESATSSKTSFEKIVLPFFSTNCYICHNEKLASGGLDLKFFKTVESLAERRETWELIVHKLSAGEMPPEGAPRPGAAELKAVIRWIESEFDRADRMVRPDPGRVTARRLNRAEYNNTVRDLLGVDARPADNFPQDDSGYGFDNIGDVLSLSPVLMEKYLAAAELVARQAVFGHQQLKPTLVQYRPQGRRIKTTSTPPSDYDFTGMTLPNSLHLSHRFPVDAEYLIRSHLGGTRPAASEPVRIALWIDGIKVQTLPLDPEKTASFEIDRQEFGGKVQDFRVKIPAGKHWVAVTFLNIYEGLPSRYNGPNPSKKPAPPMREFRMPPGVPPERTEEFRKRFEARRAETDKMPVNDFRVSFLEIGGPYNQAGGPSAESLKKIYTCGHLSGVHQPGCAHKIVSGLARRAYRRPVTKEEVDQLLSLVTAAQKEGDSFEEGICQSIQAMLVSPHFLFRIEKDRPLQKAELGYSINQHELASRLSYFLWSSMPDDELLLSADQGTLRRPAVLAAQVRRMLRDPKSSALVENFGGQWLELRKLESVTPDRQRFPEFEEYLRMSMLRETDLFIEEIVHRDRSIRDFIDAKYTYLNERLAEFYNIPGVKGPEFRRVLLNGYNQRGGILTHASVLTVSSYATRTSPVLRGKWILENILNSAPPPPPADVPNLDETKIASAASLRTQLEEHRKNPTCASCHARMDPLGFGLENYDAIGGWRAEESKKPIDASGTLPDGRTFNGPMELKAIVMADRQAFAECLTEKLLTYGLGRGLERYDKPVIKKIAGTVAANDYRFSSLVLEIVKSLPFQKRRGNQT